MHNELNEPVSDMHEPVMRSTLAKAINPFRPGSGLFPPCLAGRRVLLDVFSARLYSTITGSPRNLIVHGNKRMGKTCLLIRMEQISFIKKLLTVSTITSPENIRHFVENIAMRTYAEMKTQGFLENGACAEPIARLAALPPDAKITELEIAFTDFLLCAWRTIESFVPAVFITVDDIDLVNDATRALLFIYNVTQTLYRRNCPVIFAVSCGTDCYEQTAKKHSKLIDGFEPLEATRLLPSSRENALRVPLWEHEISFDEAVIKEISRLSDGFPLYVQHIAHYVFEEMRDELDTLALRRGYERAMQYLKRDVFAPREHELPLNEKIILTTVFEKKRISFSELLKQVKLPRGSVASALMRLKEKRLIEQIEKKYRMYDRLFGEYLAKRMKEGEGATNGVR